MRCFSITHTGEGRLDMVISFSGFDHPMVCDDAGVSVVQVSNKAMFARICQSLISGRGEEAVEPYSVWGKDGTEIASSRAFLPVVNLFDLPWKHKSLSGGLYKQFENHLLMDEDDRRLIQQLNKQLESAVAQIGFQYHGEYGFGIKWSLQRYLNAFGFGVELSPSTSLFDNLMSFIELVADVGLSETLLFVNLKTFFTEKELLELYKELVFYGIGSLLLENRDAVAQYEFERKTVIDQHFLQYEITYQSESPSSSQGRICSNGFGAVTF